MSGSVGVRRRWVVGLAVAALALSSVQAIGVVSATADPTTTPSSSNSPSAPSAPTDTVTPLTAGSPASFHPLPTTRVFDGNVGTTPVGVQITGHGGVPADATAVVVNTEVFNPSAAGYVRVTPFGQDATVAVQEFAAHQSISNLVTVQLSAAGLIQAKVSAGFARILMDVSGYYSPTSGTDKFTGVTTTRVFSSTVGTTPTAVQIAGVGPVPADATAVVVNTEVFNPSAAGYVRVTPFSADASVAVQEFGAHQTISNLVIVQLNSGKIQAKVSAGSALVLMDVSGYFRGTGSTFVPISTARVFSGTVTTTPQQVTIAGLAGVAADASAVVVNTEVFNPSTGGYVRVTPAGFDASVAVQEFTAHTTISNLVITSLVGGKLQVKVSAGSALVLMDVSGYYSAGDTTAPGPVTGLTATPTSTSVGLNWTNPVDSDFAGVIIRRAAGSTPPATPSSGVAVADVAAPTHVFNDTPLTPGTTYSYALFAHDGVPNYATAATTTTITTPLNPATISGTVVSTTGSSPLLGVGVKAFDPAGNLVAQTSTAANGTYSLTPLSANATGYSVCFDGSAATQGPSTVGYQSECFANTPWDRNGVPLGTTHIPLADNQSYPLGTVSLDSGGTISGTVTATTGGANLGNVGVFVFSIANGGFATGFSQATTAADGTYTVRGIPASTQGYSVCFDATNATGGPSTAGYISQCYGSIQPWRLSAGGIGSTAVPLAAGQAVTGINDALPNASGVSGTVSAVGGSGLAGVNVLVYSVDSGFLATGFSTTHTGVGGTYTVKNLVPQAGGFNVCFDPTGVAGASATGYQPQCYNAKAWDGTNVPPTSAAVAAASAGTLASGINATLAVGASISGTVTALTGGAAVPNVAVNVYRPDGTFLTTAHTAANGTYSVTGLSINATGYFVCFDASGATVPVGTNGFLDQCWHNVAWHVGDDPTIGTPVPASTAVNVPNINAALVSSPGIAGTVTSAGGPLAGVVVSVWDQNFDAVATATTSASGTYKVVDLAPGGYRVCFDASAATGGTSTTGYLSQCYNAVAWDPNQFGPPDGAATVILAGSATTTVNATLSAAGAIAGVVSSNPGGVGLGHVLVSVSSSNFFASVLTAANGSYRISGLPADSYVVCFDASTATGGPSTRGYLSGCHNNSTPVSVGVGATVTVNEALAAAGAVTGTVTAASGGAGLGNVNVLVYDLATNDLATQFSTRTAGDGTYSINGLSTGNYQICFDAHDAVGGSSTTGYVNQCWNNVAWPDQSTIPAGATHVAVTAAATSSGINASLATGSAIAGTVTADNGGSPLGGVTVLVFDDSQNFEAIAFTAQNGTYRVNSLPPNPTGYVVCFTISGLQYTGGNSAGGYLPECYNNVPWPPGMFEPAVGSTLIPTTAGNTATANAGLAPGGGFKGKVTAAANGAALGYAQVNVFTPGGDLVAVTSTVPNGSGAGTYVVPQVPAGSYVVCFSGDFATGGPSVTGYSARCNSNIAWDENTLPGGTTNVVVVAGALSTVNASLPNAAGITGKLTDAASPTSPVSNVQVVLYDDAGDYVTSTSNLNNGTYAFPNLPAGSYFVCFDTSFASGPSPTGYLFACNNNGPWDGSSSPSAPPDTTVAVASSAVTVNATLARGGAVSGTVTDSGVPVVGASVAVYTNDGQGNFVGQTVTSNSGTYTVPRLPTGSYFVCFDGADATGPGTSGYLLQCYLNHAWDGDTSTLVTPTFTAVSVTAGSTHSSINAALVRAGAITGSTTDAGAAPVENVDVLVFDSVTGDLVRIVSTAGDGTYRVGGLPAGSYFVCFDASFASGNSATGYLSECYNNAPWNKIDAPSSPTDALVSVTLGNTHSAVSAVLAPGGSISGTITSSATPVDSVNVELFDASDNQLQNTFSDFDGTYLFLGLPAGNYHVCVDASGSTDVSPTGLVSQCYSAKTWNGSDPPSSIAATNVAVTTSNNTTANLSLVAGGAISGTITDSGGPVSDVGVAVFTTAGALAANGFTDFDGTYQVTGLPAGSYYVCFDASFAFGTFSTYTSECYNNHVWDTVATPTGASANAVAVTAGNTTSSINAVLVGT